MLGLSEATIFYALLTFLRIGGILFALPIFGDTTTPVRVRILLSVALTLALFPTVDVATAPALPTGIFEFGSIVISELSIGLLLGYAARTAFAGLIMAASIVGYQMGFGTASLMVPDAGQQMDGFTAFHRMIVLLIFLSLGLHHMFLKALVETLDYLPLGSAVASASLATFLIKLSAGVFVTALQLAAPILISLLFTMAALGLIARTVPQMNVFTLSFPMSFIIGMLVYIASFPFMPQWLDQHFDKAGEGLIYIIRTLKT